MIILFPSSLALEIIASVLVIIGLVGAISARIVLGGNWSGYVTYKKNHELVTKGPYKIVRHPIYASALLMIIGTFLYFSYWFVLVVFALLLINFSLRVK